MRLEKPRVVTNLHVHRRAMNGRKRDRPHTVRHEPVQAGVATRYTLSLLEHKEFARHSVCRAHAAPHAGLRDQTNKPTARHYIHYRPGTNQNATRERRISTKGQREIRTDSLSALLRQRVTRATGARQRPE